MDFRFIMASSTGFVMVVVSCLPDPPAARRSTSEVHAASARSRSSVVMPPSAAAQIGSPIATRHLENGAGMR